MRLPVRCGCRPVFFEDRITANFIAEKDNSDVWKYNQLLFFYFFITENVQMRGSSTRRSKMDKLHKGAEVRIFSESLSSSNPPGRNVPEYINCRCHIFSLPPTQRTWSHYLLACHQHNFRGISAGNTCFLFTLGTRLISCYSCS